MPQWKKAKIAPPLSAIDELPSDLIQLYVLYGFIILMSFIDC